MIELRWLETRYETKKAVYPDRYGSPLMDAYEFQRVLQYRDLIEQQDGYTIATEWKTVKVEKDYE